VASSTLSSILTATAATSVRLARVGRTDGFAVTEVVVLVDAVEEQHARLGMVVGAAHDLVPQLARAHAAVDPQAVAALERALFLLRRPGFGAVHQLDLAVVHQRAHEDVGDADRQVEVLQVAFVLGVDEELDVGVVAAQHAHLCAAAAAGRFDRLATAIEDAHVADRPRSAAARAAHPRTLGPDAREVVAHAAAAAHGLCRFGQRGVDAGVAVLHLRDGIAHRLHEAVDERGRQVGAGGRGDAPCGHEAALLRLEEARFPLRALVGRLHRCQRTRHAQAHRFDRLFVALGVLFEQHLAADRLCGQGRAQRSSGVIGGAGGVHGRRSWRAAPPGRCAGGAVSLYRCRQRLKRCAKGARRCPASWPAPAGTARCPH
jgi:hypothetical protein